MVEEAEEAVKNGIKRKTYHTRRFNGWSHERASTEAVNSYKGDYAVYRGGEIVVMGTAEECATELGVTAAYIKWMTTPTGKKRLAARHNPEMATAAVKLDLEEDED